MFKTITFALFLLGLTALAAVRRSRAAKLERRHLEEPRHDRDEMLRRRKDDNVGGED
jgi:hypothetical protein